MRTFRVASGSLTDGDQTLLVNASNTNANLGTGVSGAIRAACGLGYQARIHAELQRRFDGPMEPGQVYITDAGGHATARFVAHVAVMDYRDGFTGASYPDLSRIEQCCKNLWREIETLAETVSVAMVALGAGTGNLGVRRPTEVACRTLAAHLEARDDTRIGDVVFYGYTLPEFIATIDVVRGFFELPEGSIPEDVRGLLDD